MSDPTNPLDWAEYAEEDCEMAKRPLRGKSPSTLGACFHAQQSAEKYLKAMSVAKKIDFPKTHDLSTINMIRNDHGIFTGLKTELLTILTDHAVTTRYPGDMPTMEAAKEAIEITKSIRKFSRKFLGLK
ncbi:MAG TPA: HEPN domain-containing protein [Candidatus Binatia bacterium]|nr:HEPN domain-containing protein [Candidatus Binatia bacterium]